MLMEDHQAEYWMQSIQCWILAGKTESQPIFGGTGKYAGNSGTTGFSGTVSQPTLSAFIVTSSADPFNRISSGICFK
jgi:hypothetical protein